MLTNITFKAGSSSGQPPLSIDLEPSVTLFVGPNNSGKSIALTDIMGLLSSSGGRVVQRVMLAPTSAAEADAVIERSESRLHAGHAEVSSINGQTHYLDFNTLRMCLLNPNGNRLDWWQRFGSHRVRFLNGEGRTQMLAPQQRGDLATPSTEFGRLYVDGAKRAAYRKVIADAIGLYIGIDAYSRGAEIHLLFGKTPPPDERGLPEELLEWRRTSLGPENVSDGVRAFAGLLLKLSVGDPDIVLVDEAEAFLHPALAHRLGREMAKVAVDQKKHVFAATHSAHFLMGAIQSGANINIVRLTYRDDVATARHLHSATLRAFMNDPLLRSVGVLDGLFFEHVIVCEADADRAFYSEINHRLLAAGDPRGIPHALFLNADNKQTVPTIVKALRQVGIPTAAVIDIDLIVDESKVVAKQLDACSYPEGQREGLHKDRAFVLKSLDAASPGENTKHKRHHFKTIGRGVEVLTNKAEREAADNLFDAFDRYGCFAVRSGELENWLLHLTQVPRRKDGPESFRMRIFEAMGSDPNAEGYIKPASGDVWDFIGKVRNWLVDQKRRGIPD